ncbi:unnamed protein product [Didymodactylos carnosus]|uniref:RING-type domain-containing protein n=1 Tax=Didymodactylos carnosus TaxID=1234261 RepID=A0A814KRK8_9BILA|nr:unnamed protein product [Didymodactylos carnosus]CAF1259796.1 unnamed protein product [Didymodactylos carnosus]CAF3824265.1 unnamed protein product [Didymodactylos carnosus]CAF4066500.1 unnamed protein product [Didymodactylos carnosus]
MANVASLPSKDLECGICFELFRDPVLLPCGHSFDRKCITDYIRINRQPTVNCPKCRYLFDSHTILINNRSLLNIVRSFKSIQPTRATVYEIYLLGTNTSMRYSDGLSGLFGASRLELAEALIKNVLKNR